MKRFGQVIRIKPDKVEAYKEYHANVWPEVLKRIKECNISNYSIFLKDDYLFAYFEYTGEDFEKDMKNMAMHEPTQKWWDVMNPMQVPINSRKKGEWWANMEQVFYLE